jgi:SAM-dependent MidA family methyltransferase
VDRLTSPAEMGELFKVIALGRGIGVPLLGFCRADRTHAL